jgi:hypothetical protein
MTEDELKAENLFLKQRNAELQDDVVGLQAEIKRLRDQLERIFNRKVP